MPRRRGHRKNKYLSNWIPEYHTVLVIASGHNTMRKDLETIPLTYSAWWERHELLQRKSNVGSIVPSRFFASFSWISLKQLSSPYNWSHCVSRRITKINNLSSFNGSFSRAINFEGINSFTRFQHKVNPRPTLGDQFAKKLNLAGFKDKRDGSDRFICLFKKRTGLILKHRQSGERGPNVDHRPPATQVHLEEKHVRN